MKRIAFKRAKSASNVRDSLHPEFIVEFADISLFPEGFHKPENGFEFLDESDFMIEYAKNDALQAEFEEQKRQRNALQEKEFEALSIHEQAEKRKEQREFQEFLKWKAQKAKRKQ